MTDQPEPREPESPDRPDADGAPEAPETEPQTEWQRRRRLDAVFGDVLPETTSERDPEAPRDEDGEAKDRWLRSQVPPHHG
jgi:hypothetical protein